MPCLVMASMVYCEQVGVYLQDEGSKGEMLYRYKYTGSRNIILRIFFMNRYQ